MQLTPLPGTDRASLLELLEQVRTACTNVRGAGAAAGSQLRPYLDWATDAERLLRYHLHTADLDLLILTKRYWMLQALAPDQAGSAVRTIYNELDDRARALGEAIDLLRRDLGRWRRPGLFVVPDTSVFVQHPDKLRDLRIADLLGLLEEPVNLVMPIVVIDELDNLKQSTKKHARWRAAYTLAVLDDVLRGGTTAGTLQAADFTPLDRGGIPRGAVTIEVLLDTAGHQRLPISDDEIVSQAVTLQGYVGRSVRLLTYDTGMALRARSAGVEVTKLTKPLEPEPVEAGSGGAP